MGVARHEVRTGTGNPDNRPPLEHFGQMAAGLQMCAMLEAGIVDRLELTVAAQRLAGLGHVSPTPKQYAASWGGVGLLVY